MYVMRFASCVARLEQFLERGDVPRDGARSEVLHALEVQLDVEVPLASQLLGTWMATRGFIAFEPIVEVVDRDLEEVSLGDEAAAAPRGCPRDSPSRP